MKRYLTTLFLALSVVILIIGMRSDVRWGGMVAWGLIFICLIFATYFTKYIPDHKKRGGRHS